MRSNLTASAKTKTPRIRGVFIGSPQSVVSKHSMALKSTVYKAALSIADIDNAYYADHALTLARHPSETDERMMIRLVAFAFEAHKLQTLCNGDATLNFGAGLSDPDEPDVVLRDFTGATRVWIEVGQPEEKPLAKACNKADQAAVYAFHHAAEVWWKGIENKLTRSEKLRVYRIAADTSKALEALAERSMNLSATIQDGMLSLASDRGAVDVSLQKWR
jgi:uncharacterized protein YaeQ